MPARFEQAGRDLARRRLQAEVVVPLQLLLRAARNEARREHLAERGVVAAPAVVGVLLPASGLGFVAFPLVLVWLASASLLLLRRPLVA